MKHINLFDGNFTYTLEEHGYITASHKFKPKKVTWEMRKPEFDGVTVFTDHYIKRDALGLIRSVKSPYKVAWLVEPEVIHPQPYEEIKHMINEFDLILSHHESVLSLSDKCKWVPGCGTWVDPENWKVHPKTKNVCIIASSKASTHGHILRHWVIREFGDEIDVYGRGYNPFPEKEDVLKDYMFSIEIENCSRENYFTEKLHDCLAVGTVPIYFGPKEGLDEHYDMGGIIPFNDTDDLMDILDDLSPELYQSKLASIQNNLQAAKRFAIMDDYVAGVIDSCLTA
mgnify:CR=1 FL=1